MDKIAAIGVCLSQDHLNVLTPMPEEKLAEPQFPKKTLEFVQFSDLINNCSW